ncbi:MAG: hypothetical protein JXB88_17770 [Spirochaetales bacterium]|nr:hypothetical protein [Spirochaetales bacterium]
MSGLYQRALNILNQDEASPPDLSNGISFDNESGISIEDQKEIIAQIENTVSEKRTSIDEDIHNIKPQKRGVLFPILVNIGLAALAVAMIFLIQWFVSRQEQQIQLDAKAYSGGDSKLISQMKKEAEQRLNAKEKEISLIQEQLQNLDEEKVKLQENMDSEIERKQNELEEQMKLELEHERQRLKSEGISTEDIDSQIEEIKKQKELENKQVLDDFQKQVEAQKIENEKRIEELKNEYNSNLSGLNNEKASLEKELVNAEQRVKEFEEKQAALEKQKTEAEKKLKEMAEQREKEERLNQQIQGMYETVNTQMQDGKYEDAMKSLGEMRNFFNDPATATLPGILKRREVELFIIGSLENLIRGEITKTEIDTATLLEKANLISSISAKANEAQKRYNQKDYAGAQQLYKEALAILPDIEKSYTSLSTIETSQKNQQFSTYYTQAETFYNSFNYTDAIESYRKAMKLFPEDKAKVDTMMTRIMEAGYRLQGDMGNIVEDEKNANQLLSKASQALRDKDYNKAIDYYVEILTKYARTTQATSARNGINTAVTREREALAREMDTVLAEKDRIIAEKDAMIDEMDKTDILSSIALKAKEADSQYKSKNYNEAKTLYEQTLGIIPEVEISHKAILFINNTAKNELFIRYCTEAETSYSNHDYKKTINYYTEAIKLFPQDQSVVNTIMLRIMESGYKLNGDPAIVAEEEKKANEILIKASRELKAKNYETALDSYIDILTLYPRTSHAISARNGVKTTMTWEKEAIIAQKDTEIDDLESTISKKDSEIAGLNKIKSDFTQKIEQLENDKKTLESELTTLRKQVEEGTTASGATILPSPEPTPAIEDIPSQAPTRIPGEDEVIIRKEEMEEYNKLKQQIIELKDQYMKYTQEEDRIIAKQGSLGYLKTKTILGDLLHSEFAKEIFPDLYERLKRFDDALAEDARTDGQYLAVDTILDIIYDRMVLDSEAEISRYWKELKNSYKDDSLFLELLDELEDMME